MNPQVSLVKRIMASSSTMRIFLAALTPAILIATTNANTITTSTTSRPVTSLPFVINTWSGPFTDATDAAFAVLVHSRLPLGSGSSFSSGSGFGTALDAVQAGCSTCEERQCDGSVGFGGSPDESCETTLDAMLMDGDDMNVGAVADLRRVKSAVTVARGVLERTTHSLLAGEQARRFAVELLGLEEEDLGTEASRRACEEWRGGWCQPNYRVNVSPDPERFCGPYTPLLSGGGSSVARKGQQQQQQQQQASHDTISMVAIDASGSMAAGTSTNGATHKIPGRVGDGPIAGSGSYVDSEVGGCGATGDGDIMMRFLPCYQAVESLRRGMSPQEAADDAVERMVRRYPAVRSGIVVVDREGRHAGSASGWTFTYSWRGGQMEESSVVVVQPLNEVREEL